MWSGAGGVLRVAALAGLRRWPVAWSAVSQAAADAFSRSLGVDVAVLPDAVDVEAWAPRAGAHAPVSDVVTLVTVGRLMPRKRPLHLVRVLEQVRTLVAGTEVRLVIVGDGPLRRRVQRLVRRRALTDHVHVTGRVPRSEVVEHLRAASVYVVPARKESFGIAALEARCAGLPVVADRSSGVPEFVRDRVDGLLVDGDQEMTVALAELVRDAGLRARITAHNRRVRPVQDWTHAMERTRELYATACARVPIAAPEPTPAAAALEA
jgi:glycosyltransferase involved in cell wall biosynthesis